MRRIRMSLLAGMAALGAPSMALAHMPFLLPNMFDAGQRDHVTVQGGFAEDAFVTEVAMKSDAFHVRGPAGSTPIAAPTYLRDLTVFEAPIPAAGTYRISSGERFGRKGRMYKDDKGHWIISEAERAPPGAVFVDVQSMTLAEAYVSRGAPSDEALAPTGRNLELKPLTHPNKIFAGNPARFALLFEGKPVPGATVELFRAAGVYDGRKKAGEAVTDAAGGFSLTPPDAGTYLALIRHRTASPPGAETPYRSYSYTLTFEATE